LNSVDSKEINYEFVLAVDSLDFLRALWRLIRMKTCGERSVRRVPDLLPEDYTMGSEQDSGSADD
jgi:hypothetical protein